MATIKEVKPLPLKDLVIGKGQVRLRDVKKDVTELADSIGKVGPLLCTGLAYPPPADFSRFFLSASSTLWTEV